MTPEELREMSEHLIDLAARIGSEGEGLDLTDLEFNLDDIVELRSKLSGMRKGIDMVNKALANYWNERYPGERLETEYDSWYVGNTKTKRLMDADLFMEYIATKDADELARLFTPSQLARVIKVTGMTPAEKDTHIIEEHTKAGLSIQSKRK